MLQRTTDMTLSTSLVSLVLLFLPLALGFPMCGDGICSSESPYYEECNQDCYLYCGADGYCQMWDNHTTCPEDCLPTCGNGVCDPPATVWDPAETDWNCARDCNPICGDGVCAQWENITACAKDCTPKCGDGICAYKPASGYAAETVVTCAKDCTKTCGDGVCAISKGEHLMCAKDCSPTCGDGVCASSPLPNFPKETASNCPQDCTPICGDGECEGIENCLDCPRDCGCKFNGGKVILYNCAPGNITLSTCVNSTYSATLPTFTNVGSGINLITVKYISYLKPSAKLSGNFMFLINATNVGARLFINDKKLIDAYFPQDKILTTAKALLPSTLIHKLELQFYSMSASAPRNVNLLWRDLNDPSSSFNTLNETYYSVNNCGDHIFDSYETTLKCSKDFTGCQLASCQNKTDCGDGVCLEQSPEDCFVDCHQFLTTQCSSIAAKPGFLSQNLPVEVDTLGDLIRNQMLWHLPGLEHMQYGMNIVTGEAAGAPLFYFGYCSENIGETIQDTYRGNLYALPSEIYAQPSPKCQYSATATSFSSSIKMANSFALDSGMEASGEAGGGWDGISAKASFSYSQESSVKAARQMEQKQSGSLILTELMCATSKVQMNKYTFHPSFLQELSRVNSSDDILDMIDKYGTHFYQRAVLGGKLRQVTSVSKSHASSKTKTELESNAQRSFGASVTSPVFSVSGDYSDSIDSSISASDQQTFESASTHSTVLTYGGPPGSFGPSSSEAPSNFGDWASSVDLLPVPIKYELKRISDKIPSEWKARNGTSLQSLWERGELLWKERQIIYEEGLANKYTLYWFWDSDEIHSDGSDPKPRPLNETFRFVVNAYGTGTLESYTLMEQSGPAGTYAPFSFYWTDAYSTNNPARFELYSSFDLSAGYYDIESFESYDYQITLGDKTAYHCDGTQLSTFILHDWQTGIAINIDKWDIVGNEFQLQKRDLDTLGVAKFYFEIQSLSVNFSTSELGKAYCELTIYHTNGTRVYLDLLPIVNVFSTSPSPLFFKFDSPSIYPTPWGPTDFSGPNANQTAVDGIPYQVSLRIGSKIGSSVAPGWNSTLSFAISDFWLQTNYCESTISDCFTDAPGYKRTRRVFSMEPSKTVEYSLSDKTPLVIPIAPLNQWL